MGVHPEQVQAAAVALCLSISQVDVDWLFNGSKPSSAKSLRDTLIHDFGPTHVDLITAHASVHDPRMTAFLTCSADVLKHLT